MNNSRKLTAHQHNAAICQRLFSTWNGCNIDGSGSGWRKKPNFYPGTGESISCIYVAVVAGQDLEAAQAIAGVIRDHAEESPSTGAEEAKLLDAIGQRATQLAQAGQS